MRFCSNVIIVAAMALVMAMFYGCGKSVNTVKNGFLTGWEQTSVGNAFDAFFNEPTWTLKESANKTQFVEFTGKVKEDVFVDKSMSLVIPKNNTVMFQFILKKDKNNSFSITYCEAPLAIGGPPELKESLSFALKFQGLSLDGKPSALGEGGINALLKNIYQ